MIPNKLVPQQSFSNINDNHHLIGDAIKNIQNNLLNKLDNLIIEGLRRKGFVFENKNDLEKFIITNCRSEDNSEKKQKTYFVFEAPFVVHSYGILIDTRPIVKSLDFTIGASTSYAFV